MACRPPANHTYLAIGQDLFSISEYVQSQYNFSLHNRPNSNAIADDTLLPLGGGLSVKDFVPAAYMVYTDIQSLDGLWEPTDYGSGVEYADGVIDLFDYDTPRKPGDAASHQKQPLARTGLQIGLWLNGTAGCFDIASGNLDGRVRDLVTYLEQSRARRIFIRIGYEFDNPMFGYDDPKMYVVAFRKLVTAIRSSVSKETRNRVIFVWHSWAAPMASDDLSLESYYPGDSYVDWIGISIFQQVLPWSPDWGGKRKDVERVLRFAQERHKASGSFDDSNLYASLTLASIAHDDRRVDSIRWHRTEAG